MITRIKRIAARLKQTRAKFGGRAALETVVDRVGSLAAGLQVIDVVWLECSQVSELSGDDPRFAFRFLRAEEVRRFAENPDLKLSSELAARIEAGRDMCFAALEGERLAAYGWYAIDCIEGEHNFGVPMSFPADAAYMYNGFTHPDYRGLRLHGRVMGLALKALQAKGVTRLVSTVDWTNHPSLRSCQRLGYERLGRIVTIGGELAMVLKSPVAAMSRGVRFGRQADRRSPLPLEKPAKSAAATVLGNDPGHAPETAAGPTEQPTPCAS